jgi:hypothetical protein
MLSRRSFARPVLLASYLAGFILIASVPVASAKDKKKLVLPADILEARTVLVLVDPDAGLVPEAPNANPNARDDVEKALMKWGRFSLVQNGTEADLIITVRKGNGKIAQTTIGGVPVNDRPVILQPTDSGGRIGAQHGGISDDPSNNARRPLGPHPREEIGPTQDMFVVYRGDRDNPLDFASVWRSSAEDALRSPDVPAVAEFRKVIAEAEKQQAAKP